MIKVKQNPSRRAKWWHRWLGLTATVFLLVFASSGILLNHREGLRYMDIPRSVLPSAYRFSNWSLGAIKGGVQLAPDSILLYGSSGVWLTDSLHRAFAPYTQGMEEGIENRLITNLVRTARGEYFALATYELYHLDKATATWRSISDRLGAKERFTDLATQGDSLVVQTRSDLFVSSAPYSEFERRELGAPIGYKPKVGLFRTLWTLHSGELFGLVGQLFVDLLGSLCIFLALTGLVLTFFPRMIRKRRKERADDSRPKRIFKLSFELHNKLGVWFLICLIALTLTGMFLRPPLLIAVVKGKHSPLPWTHQDSPNPWKDKLRSLRYDDKRREWLFYTSEGFYTSATLDAVPRQLAPSLVPPVSFMGTTVFQPLQGDYWLVGSFSGLYAWDRATGMSINLYTKQRHDREPRGGMPSFSYSVAGFCDLFSGKPIVFDYNRGAESLVAGQSFAPQIAELEDGRISLWHTALEAHVGRIYTFLPSWMVQIFIFASGCFMLATLLSGYFVRKRS